MSLYYCWVTKMANAVVLWVLVYFCVTSVNTKDKAPYGPGMQSPADQEEVIYEIASQA